MAAQTPTNPQAEAPAPRCVIAASVGVGFDAHGLVYLRLFDAEAAARAVAAMSPRDAFNLAVQIYQQAERAVAMVQPQAGGTH